MEDLMKLFETESYKAWAALELEEEKQVKGAEITMQQAEDYFDSVIETAVDEFRRFEEEMEREAKAELSGVDDTAEKVKKIGDLMEKGANIASKLYVEAAMKSAGFNGLSPNKKKWDFLVSFRKSREKKRKCESLWWKTTIVLKINGEDTSVISPTLGFNIKTITYQKYTLNIWDVGGQRTIRSYWRNYFEQTDGLVWVVDSSDLRRLDDCKMELDTLLKEERLSRASLLILANKQDIKGALTQAEIAKILKVWQSIQSLQAGKAKA